MVTLKDNQISMPLRGQNKIIFGHVRNYIVYLAYTFFIERSLKMYSSNTREKDKKEDVMSSKKPWIKLIKRTKETGPMNLV